MDRLAESFCQNTQRNRRPQRTTARWIPIFRFVLGEIISYPIMKNNPRSTSVPPIQTVKGRVVFFHKVREKISTLKPLAVWIFAVAISPPKTGNRIKKSCPRFRPLHSNGKTVYTTSAAGGRFCGGSAPAPPTSPKEQNGMLRNRAWKGLIFKAFLTRKSTE